MIRNSRKTIVDYTLPVILALVLLSGGLLGTGCARLSPIRTEKAALPVRENEIGRLIENLKGERSVRNEARKALIEIGKPTIPALIEASKGGNFTLQWEAVNIMGYIGDKEATPHLLEQVLRSTNNHVRWRAIWALNTVKDERVVSALLKGMKGNEKTERWNAAVALSTMEGGEAVPVLLEGLNSPDSWIRWEAVNALGRVNNKEVLPALIPLLKDNNVRIRQETCLSLGKMVDKGAVSSLIEALDDGTPGVRWRAAMALGQIRDKGAIEALEERLKKEKDKLVLKHLNEALRKLKE